MGTPARRDVHVSGVCSLRPRGTCDRDRLPVRIPAPRRSPGEPFEQDPLASQPAATCGVARHQRPPSRGSCAHRQPERRIPDQRRCAVDHRPAAVRLLAFRPHMVRTPCGDGHRVPVGHSCVSCCYGTRTRCPPVPRISSQCAAGHHSRRPHRRTSKLREPCREIGRRASVCHDQIVSTFDRSRTIATDHAEVRKQG